MSGRSLEDEERWWDGLEDLARRHSIRGTKRRLNLEPGAERDAGGKYRKKAIKSDTISEGPILEYTQSMVPSFQA